MAQIAGVPTLQPVDQPMMSPRIAGRPGAAIAELGGDTEQIASEGLQLQTHIRNAQKAVDQVAFQNQAKAQFDKYQIELKKTQNSRDIPDLMQKAQDDFRSLTKQWEKSPAYMEIQQQADGLMPSINEHGQIRSIDLMGKEWNAQIELQKHTLIPQLATAIRNGDTAQADYIRGYISHQYDEAEKNGLISSEDRKLDMDAQQIIIRKQLNEAAIMSANPSERMSAISQLKNGGSGPLDLNGLAPGDISALREHAMEANNTLTRLSEAQGLNAKLNITHNAFQAPEFKDNFEAQIKALNDPEWLTKHGIVDENGQPDFVMAEKLSAESVREEGFRKKEQADRDEKAIETYSAAIDENHMSRAAIDALPGEDQGGISNKARAMMIRQWTQNNTLNRQMATMERQEAQRAQQEISDGVRLDFYQRIGSGELVDPLEVKTAAGLTKKDKADVIQGITIAKNEPDFVGAISMLNTAIGMPKPPKNATPEQMQAYQLTTQRQAEDYHETLAAYNEEMKAHPGQNKQEAMRKVLDPVVQKKIGALLDQRFGITAPVVAKPSFMDVLKTVISGGFNYPQDKGLEPGKMVPKEEAPKVGDVKNFPNGRKGKWDGTGWVAQ
jgi:hypothetical protein